MKILFLDCDGVLNCQQTFVDHRKTVDPLDLQMVKRVQKIVKETGCKVVMSSTWRRHDEARESVNKLIPLFGVTPSVAVYRGKEIQAWLKEHPEVTKYVCLDDDSDFYPEQHLFKTNWLTGLTDEITNEVINYFNEETA